MTLDFAEFVAKSIGISCGTLYCEEVGDPGGSASNGGRRWQICDRLLPPFEVIWKIFENHNFRLPISSV
jgi:hypothetical protein